MPIHALVDDAKSQSFAHGPRQLSKDFDISMWNRRRPDGQTVGEVVEIQRYLFRQSIGQLRERRRNGSGVRCAAILLQKALGEK